MKINKKTLLFFKSKQNWMIGTFILLAIIVSLSIILSNHPKSKTIALSTTKNAQPNLKTTSSNNSLKKTSAATTTTTPSAATTTVNSTPLAIPAAPTNPIGTAISPTSISLSWTASNGRGTTIADYYVLRNNSIVAKINGTSYTDNNRTPNTSYTYSIEAIGSDNQISAKSTAIQVQTPPVFAVTLGTGTVAIPPPYQYPLGNPIDFDFPVTSNTAGTITYEIVDSYGIVMQAPTTFTFNAAGTQDITLDFVTPEGWPSENVGSDFSATAQLEISTPTTTSSNPVAFDWADF
ncbi:MAG TPA: fibronectin type III domain-containing protein [Candidatus Saccharimonadia bacterium]|nr:fibronectin type III domain-containing protein [Candidatus Saccharimonadia bacterium]